MDQGLVSKVTDTIANEFIWLECREPLILSFLCVVMHHLFSLEITTNWPGDKPSENIFDRSVLPSAPRASQALQIDRSRLPKSPPYTVYLGNLSYECSEEDIKRFFDVKKLSVRKTKVKYIVLA